MRSACVLEPVSPLHANLNGHKPHVMISGSQRDLRNIPQVRDVELLAGS